MIPIDSQGLHSFVRDLIVWKVNCLQTLELAEILCQRFQSLIRDLIVWKIHLLQTLELVSIRNQPHDPIISNFTAFNNELFLVKETFHKKHF